MKQEKVILGITAFNHDSSACLIYKNKIIAFCEEERFNKIKHTGEFPLKSVLYCLNEAKLSMQDITDVVFYFNLKECFLGYLKNNNPFLYAVQPSLIKRKRFYYEAVWLFNFVNKVNSIKRILRNHKIKITYIDHHISHIWYGYFASGFRNCTVISNDSVGETVSSLAVRIKRINNKVIFNKIFSQNDPHSLGYLYGAVTEFLGFKRGSDEGKVMAMAALGTNKYMDYFRNSIRFLPNGEFRINNHLIYPRNFQPKGKRMSDKFIKQFGKKIIIGERLTQHHHDIAYALQKITESILDHQLNRIEDNNIVLTGGVAQNSLANGKLNNAFLDKNVFVPPIPNDAGCSIGAALFLNYKYHQKVPLFVDTAFLGPKFSENEIIDVLENSKIQYEHIRNSTEFIVNQILKGKIIALFRGKMECGPRALGHRSIFCSPINPRMKDILNSKVKNREFFQPYGGIILDKYVRDIFDYRNKIISGPYMSFVYRVRKEWINKVPSLVHFDGTSRVQVIKERQDNFLENILEIFYQKTGVPLIINTSLNLKGQPIVNNPQDALGAFYNSAIDHILFNECILVSK